MERVEKAVQELFTDIGDQVAAVKTRIEKLSAESASAQPEPVELLKNVVSSEELGGGDLEIEIPEPTGTLQDTKWQKKCPMCGGNMHFLLDEGNWQCYSCAYEEAEQEKVSGKRETPETSATLKDTKWQKKCPMCGGQMHFLLDDEKWQCYSCAYEESGASEVSDKGTSKKRNTNALELTRGSEPIFDIFPEKQEEKKETLPTKKKTCPGCRKKMQWYPNEQIWRCPHCEYERRI
jgi:ribosomal protein L37AE/L43A